MYTVVRGDTLSGIASERHVRGGWRQLYAANRGTIGADPDLILPGQRLHMSGSGTAAPPAPGTAGPRGDKGTSQPQKAGESQKPQKPEKTEKAEQSRKAGKPQKAGKTQKSQQAEQGRPSREQRSQERAGTRHALVSPVGGALVGTPYHAAGSSWSKGYHTGVDFPVPTGTSVRSVAPGTVVEAGWGGSFGYQVVIRHADGRYSQYAHLSAISVRDGQSVGGGQRIGRSGSTGNSSGPHLHFEVRTGPGFGTDVDPLAYLRAGGVRI
jgi:murein DD-endopeptidase MepM/ murein hydrolase activator NlpD